MKRAFILIGIFLLFSSHELFLKTDSYFLGEGEAVDLYLFNGTFDKSENVITSDRIVNAKIIGPDFEFNPKDSDYYEEEKVTHLKFTTGNAGSYVAGISTVGRNIELTASEFKEYLEHEGLDRVVKEREGKGISGKAVVEKYSKHVKALLQVSNETSDEYMSELGYPIEFIPLQNPYELDSGDNIEFQLIYKGEPLANTVVHFGYKSDSEKETKINASITDENGEFSFELQQPGQWFVATIHMEESTEEGLDYESNWATLTFAFR